MLLNVGDEVERYTVEGFLGRGAMAEVYRVRHRTLKTTHALKVLMLASARIRERLIQEGQVQAQIRHPNVLSVTDVLDVQGAPGLLMELVEGPTLEEWLHQERPSLPQAEAMFRGVLAGVGEAHALGLVHRDLKPANVLVARTARGPVPKVADFGLAKVLAEAEGGGMHRTRSGSALGTPAYMAPEQIRDAKRVDHRADIFSLGCILYEVCVGRRPFDGEDLLSVFNQVASGRYEPAPHLPERIQRAIAGALLVEREARIPSCDVFEAVLEGRQSRWEPLPGAPMETTAPVTGETLLPLPLEEVAARAPASVEGTWADDEGDAPAPAAEAGLAAVPPAAVPRPPPLAPAPTLAPPLPRPVDSAMSMEFTAPVAPSAPAAAPPAVAQASRPPSGMWRWGVGGGALLATTLVAVRLVLPTDVVVPEPMVAPAASIAPDAAGPSPAEPSPAPPVPGAAASSAPAVVPPPAPPAAAPAVVDPPRLSTPSRSAAEPARPAGKATPPPAPAASPPAAAVASATGRLTAMSMPPGTILVDGKPRGARFKDLELPAGPHDIEVQGPGGEVARRTVTVPAGGGASFCWDFELDDTCN